MIEMEDQQQMMCIREQRTLAEPVKELEEVNLMTHEQLELAH